MGLEDTVRGDSLLLIHSVPVRLVRSFGDPFQGANLARGEHEFVLAAACILKACRHVELASNQLVRVLGHLSC